MLLVLSLRMSVICTKCVVGQGEGGCGDQDQVLTTLSLSLAGWLAGWLAGCIPSGYFLCLHPASLSLSFQRTASAWGVWGQVKVPGFRGMCTHGRFMMSSDKTCLVK